MDLRQAFAILADALGALLCTLLAFVGLVLMFVGIFGNDDRHFLVGIAAALGFGMLGMGFCTRGLDRERDRS